MIKMIFDQVSTSPPGISECLNFWVGINDGMRI